MKQPKKPRARSKVLVQSIERDRAESTVTAMAVAAIEHTGGGVDRGSVWIDVKRPGFEISAQLTTANAIALRDQLNAAIEKAGSHRECTYESCYACRRGRYAEVKL